MTNAEFLLPVQKLSEWHLKNKNKNKQIKLFKMIFLWYFINCEISLQAWNKTFYLSVCLPNCFSKHLYLKIYVSVIGEQFTLEILNKLFKNSQHKISGQKFWLS